MLSELTEQHARGDSSNWEAGGQSNFMITASRLGLRVASAANVGDDVYGTFLIDVLRVRVMRLKMLRTGSRSMLLRCCLMPGHLRP